MKKLNLTGNPDIYSVKQGNGHSVLTNIETGKQHKITHRPKQ